MRGKSKKLSLQEKRKRQSRNERRGRTPAFRQAKIWAKDHIKGEKRWSLADIVAEEDDRRIREAQARIERMREMPVHPKQEHPDAT